jgi:two-component system sensor histidine kinase YesM
VEKINAILRQSARPAGFTHFGLYNINRRIVQAYGPEYGLTVSSEFNVFTRVELRLPRTPGKEEENRDVL